jgi:hypothetical protein
LYHSTAESSVLKRGGSVLRVVTVTMGALYNWAAGIVDHAIMLRLVDMTVCLFFHVGQLAAFPLVKMAISVSPVGKMLDLTLLMLQSSEFVTGKFTRFDTLSDSSLLIVVAIAVLIGRPGR